MQVEPDSDIKHNLFKSYILDLISWLYQKNK